MPWTRAVELLVPEPARRPNYLRWTIKFKPSGSMWGVPHAAIMEPDATLSIDDLVTVLAYVWLSRHSRYNCSVESFSHREVTDSKLMDYRFEAAPVVRTGAFNVADADPEMLNALARVRAVRADTGAKEEDTPGDRLFRAVRLHNEAHWIWAQRASARPLFVLAMALAFEALFTPKKEKLRRNGDPSALRLDEEEVKQAVDEDAYTDLTDAVRDFILSTSFVEQVAESAVQAARSPTAGAKDGIRKRLIEAVRSRLVGGSGILAALRNGVLATLSNTGMDAVTHEQMRKWCNEFYGLRSAIAHGDAIEDSSYRFEDVRRHEFIARDVFRAVVFESLVKLGCLSPSTSKRLRHTFTHPALASVVPNNVRLKSIETVVKSISTNPPGDGPTAWDFWDNLHLLLKDIGEDDLSCSGADLQDALAALKVLQSGLPGVPQYVVNEADAAQRRLVSAVEISCPPLGSL